MSNITHALTFKYVCTDEESGVSLINLHIFVEISKKKKE